MNCENNLFVNCISSIKKEYLLGLLQDKVLFFKTYINIENETIKQGYGTDSDVYLEYMEVVEIFENVLHFKFYTNDSPCVEFSKRFAAKYSVNIQLVYYNFELNFSGKLNIHNQHIIDEIWDYHQGLYYTDKDRFWDSIEENNLIFNFLSPEDLLTFISLKISKM